MHRRKMEPRIEGLWNRIQKEVTHEPEERRCTLERELYKLGSLYPSPLDFESDLLKMVQHNNKQLLPTYNLTLSALIYICSHGMIYGAMESRCITCGGMLCYDHGSYRCMRLIHKESLCRDDQYYFLEVSPEPWKYPSKLNSTLLEFKDDPDILSLLSSRNPSIIHIPFQESINRARVREKIREHLSLSCTVHHKIQDGRSVLYSFFMVKRSDLSDGKYVSCQITRNSSNEYVYNLDENVYAKRTKPIQEVMTEEEAVKIFERKFQCNSGMQNWKAWCQRREDIGAPLLRPTCITTASYLLPLNFNYSTALAYGNMVSTEFCDAQFTHALNYTKHYIKEVYCKI